MSYTNSQISETFKEYLKTTQGHPDAAATLTLAQCLLEVFQGNTFACELAGGIIEGLAHVSPNGIRPIRPEEDASPGTVHIHHPASGFSIEGELAASAKPETPLQDRRDKMQALANKIVK